MYISVALEEVVSYTINTTPRGRCGTFSNNTKRQHRPVEGYTLVTDSRETREMK